MALVDFEIVSVVDLVTPDAASENFCRAPPTVEDSLSLVNLVTPAAVSEILLALSFWALDALSDTRFIACSPAPSAARCVLSRVFDAASCACLVAFLALSRTVDEAFSATLLAVFSAMDLEDSTAAAAWFLSRSMNDDDVVEGRLLLSSGERRRGLRVVE